jgi:hypothetical protein
MRRFTSLSLSSCVLLVACGGSDAVDATEDPGTAVDDVVDAGEPKSIDASTRSDGSVGSSKPTSGDAGPVSKDAGSLHDAGPGLDANLPTAEDSGAAPADELDASTPDSGASDARAPSTADAASTPTDASSGDAGEPSRSDASTKDASSSAPDAGGEADTDAGPEQGAACTDDAPHGCFDPEPENAVTCPPRVVEQGEVSGCGNAVSTVSCVYEGPAHALVACQCATGLPNFTPAWRCREL